MDIILLIFLAFKISKLAEQKGQQKNKWVFILVFAWVIGEILGGFIGLMLFGMKSLIPIALLALGFAGTSYFMVLEYLKKMPDKNERDIDNIGM
jgi:predicted branched-subunit amino acid permease